MSRKAAKSLGPENQAISQDSQIVAGERIVVAMSGGVDSCASALLLSEQGFSVIGVSMQVWDYRKNGGSASKQTCCAPSDFEDAREVAAQRGFPFYVFDFEDSFHQQVIAPFIDSYRRGLTPNPCLDCNRKVKFRELRTRARALGAAKVATGHYAQIRETAEDKLGLFISRDRDKDQSYFLYAMCQHDLEHTLFPVGGMTKSEVRSYLEARGFAAAHKAESQDICFIGSSVAEFIQREASPEPGEGEIVNQAGQVLGAHQGVWKYTVGQRRGLGVSSENPLYVLDIDAERKRITIGEKKELARRCFHIGAVNWISGKVPAQPITALVKMRYRHQGVLCSIEPLDQLELETTDVSFAEQKCFARISFLDEWSAVSPGQAAVFYRESINSSEELEVLGGGIILKGRYE